MSRVMIVATGGTIANTLSGRVSVEDVLAGIATAHPATTVESLAELEIDDVLREGAETFTPDEWLTVRRSVQRAVDRDDVDGVVVTHGTYTAEETAYFLHLTVRTEKPVVVACSQRKHATIGNDGDKNLWDSVRVAVHRAARGRGVMMVINDEIHCARDVTKTSQRPGGFRSNYTGVLGGVEDDGVSFYRTPDRKHTHSAALDVLAGPSLPRVDIVASYAGSDAFAIDAALAAGARGIVVNGFCFNGRPHRFQVESLEKAVAQGIPVVLTSRGGDGRVPHNDGPFVTGDNLTAQKARVLLTVALAAGIPMPALQECFDTH